MKNLFGFGGRSRPEDNQPPKVTPSEPASADALSETSFLTGDERADSSKLTLLLRTIAEVNSMVDLNQLLVSIVDKAITVTKAERGLLLLRDAKTRALSVHVARDARGADVTKDTRYSRNVTAQVDSSGVPVRTMVNSDVEALEIGRSVFDLKIRAVMCVPLTVNKKTLGVVYVDSRVASREFTVGDLAFFAAFASQAAIALENARLVKESIEKERMAQELRLANEIQRRMLPSSAPRVQGYDLHGYYEPTTEATGDAYDFVTLPRGGVAVVVGDVSGHGIGPALVSMSARARLRTYLGMGVALGEAVSRLHRDLQGEIDDGTFQTLFVMTLDPARGEIRFVNAGHPPACLLRAATGEFEALTRTGPALGWPHDEQYQPAGPIELAPGDLLLAYTDGIVEARRGKEELFGEDRLRRSLALRRGGSAQGVVDGLVGSVKEFCGGRAEDDLTLVALKRLA